MLYLLVWGKTFLVAVCRQTLGEDSPGCVFIHDMEETLFLYILFNVQYEKRLFYLYSFYSRVVDEI
jgi:hypothetical protein